VRLLLDGRSACHEAPLMQYTTEKKLTRAEIIYLRLNGLCVKCGKRQANCGDNLNYAIGDPLLCVSCWVTGTHSMLSKADRSLLKRKIHKVFKGD